jgi:hypothetical protein
MPAIDPNAPCSNCGHSVGPHGYREVTGFEQMRSGGGANQITHRRETGTVLCPACMSALKTGSIDQQALI